MLLFETPAGRAYLHCGDMRYEDAMTSDPMLERARGCDAVYLDTTYAVRRGGRRLMGRNDMRGERRRAAAEN
jgi:hypothetical protein